MKAVYLVMHQSKPDGEALVRQVVDAFTQVGITVQAEPWLMQKYGKAVSFAQAAEDGSAIEAVISMGGDGTLLRANQMALKLEAPLLGINVGRVGFLAELELEQLQNACEFLKRDEYHMETRMMLQAEVHGQPPLLALNDVVVSRGGYSRLIAMNAWVDEEPVGQYAADGLIVSTPTGSTGYSLSAGGPIVCPDVDCMIISPICAHSLQQRPVVLSPQKTVVVGLDCDPSQTAQLSVDGLSPIMLRGKQRVVITKAREQARLIRLQPQGFFGLIRRKLSEWSC